MEESVVKATDENLTSENWELILAVCDKVDSDNEDGARNAVLAIQKRLGHRNATVQLQSLSVTWLNVSCANRFNMSSWQKHFPKIVDRKYTEK